MKPTILCIKDSSITPQSLGLIPAQTTKDLQAILGDEIWAVPRAIAEDDPTFRQVIPYVTLISESGTVLAYRRGEAGQEGRLHDLWSIGVGGHTEIGDLFEEDVTGETEDPWDFLMSAALREVQEELPNSWIDVEDLQVAGVIRLAGSDVDKVHVGVWIIAVVPDDEVEAVLVNTEDTIEKADWAYVEQLETLELEAWSELVLQRLVQQSTCSCGGNCSCQDQYVRDNDGA